MTKSREAMICSEARKCVARLIRRVTQSSDVNPGDRFVRSGLISKYWDVDEPIDHKTLANKAEVEWLEYDMNLSWSVTNEMFEARKLLRTWLSTYRRDANLIDITPGEHAIPSRGQVSVEAKLVRKWSCTKEAFSTFSSVCYRVAGMKRAGWRHISLHLRKVYPNFKQRKKLLKRLYANCCWEATRKGYTKSRWTFYAGQLCFQTLLSQVVDECAGSRFATVPKNNNKRRPINIEPFGNLIVQRQVALPLRRILREIGNDLEIGQQRHRELIKDPDYATIDFSNASDSLHCELVRWLFPKKLVDDLMMSRSPWLETTEGNLWPIRKISAMGNGFTFELLTLTLLAVARVLDPTATVYGDDVIIKNDVASQFVGIMESIGFTVNSEKSFINSPFRESCGAFYHDSQGYITRYDFREIENIRDVIVHGNKALNIFLNTKGILAEYFYDYWRDIINLVPKFLQGPPSPEELESRYLVNLDMEYEKWDSDIQQHYTHVYMVEYHPRKRTPTLRDLPRWKIGKLLMYLHAGKVSDDLLRGAGKLTIKRRRLIGHLPTANR
uniref:RNA-directed RNA polymerase n=1 Tax=Rymill virus TaxID=2707259 RepID=A0A6H0DIE5_9VIRU|nr:MAG: RNA-dependent RNA polymerase [Rymill virus]